jgi:hypothetical protein
VIQLRKYKNLNGKFNTGVSFEIETSAKIAQISRKIEQFSDVKIPYKQGCTQVDLICVFGSECLVVELKNYRKYIRGSSDEKFWEASSGGVPFKVMNPMYQNFCHCTALMNRIKESRIRVSGLAIRDYIVLPDECCIEVPEQYSKYVIHQLTLMELLTSKVQRDFVSSDALVELLRKWQKNEKFTSTLPPVQ